MAKSQKGFLAGEQSLHIQDALAMDRLGWLQRIGVIGYIGILTYVDYS